MRVGPFAGVISLLALGGIAALSAACSDSATSTTAPATSTVTTTASPAPTTTASTTATEPSDEADEIELQMTDNVFEPKDITIPVGKTVKIKVKNVGTAIHNMRVLSTAAEGKDFTSDQLVNAGGESEFEVTFTKPGTIPFQCDFHVPDMAGTITVQ